jgi:AraC-like DNA-binding protein
LYLYNANGYGYKAVIISRAHAPGGIAHDQTHIVSRTLKTRADQPITELASDLGFSSASHFRQNTVNVNFA